jgi:hypothetical protein
MKNQRMQNEYITCGSCHLDYLKWDAIDLLSAMDETRNAFFRLSGTMQITDIGMRLKQLAHIGTFCTGGRRMGLKPSVH